MKAKNKHFYGVYPKSFLLLYEKRDESNCLQSFKVIYILLYFIYCQGVNIFSIFRRKNSFGLLTKEKHES
ncbi:Uncharacterized protein CTYZ_00002740 [Cryptosporidium tyzzeri]|uniref:Uncharacterized protein n=1 Tax=Cryptosporidium hominis TaxID=237895 RepID=A0ABX5BAF3_CRYHO|nr:hypothetical protein [Cryptosporidium hominis TU502]PPS92988.1 Uncharacterized protein GY17_00003831 [Cryptosporidium hominis]TRY52295.1 Uncharacterized protein CTYZ_00002740 [Cryptosporidium tyzzeri]|eukprot:PPS92988.1 Uncharacterized protein GY17_00003831 [Cryptosporidium hominis]